MGRVVLVTGVSRYLGGRMAQILTQDPDVDRVIGVDVVAPRQEIGGAEFVRADIRNPIIAKVIDAAQVDTVVHMGVIATPMQAGGRMSMKEINVIGTMQLLAACQKSPTVRKLVVKSTSSVYGAGPKDPAMFTEEMEPKHAPTSGWAKDSVEVEGYVRGFARRRPDVAGDHLALRELLRPAGQTPMATYFSLPVIPVVLGFDAWLQFIHEDDGLEALRRATVEDHPGTFNVAGDGVILVSQAARRAGRPVAAGGPAVRVRRGGVFRRLGLADFSPEQVRFLTYGRGIDTTRMRAEFGFVPQHTTPETFEAFVEAHNLNRLLPAERVESLRTSCCRC
ncbi:MAG: NAD-dependent epimerase/dehydratase family protein [Micrococcales bacterium]|nr:NAD-dependent epimerase/dehydratase family protein [Micrococcales bacterium]